MLWNLINALGNVGEHVWEGLKGVITLILLFFIASAVLF